MKKVLCCLCIVWLPLFLTIACSSSNMGIDLDNPQDPPKDNDLDEEIQLTFDYTRADQRSLLACDSYSQAQKIQLEKDLASTLGKYESKRAKSVAAAVFLASLDYCVPYAYEWKTVDPGWELAGRYTRKGLFLNSIQDTIIKGTKVTLPAWGCMIPTHERYPRHQVEGLGDEYENGFHCSSLLSWCFYNAGAVTDVGLLNNTYADDYPEFPNTRMFNLKNAVEAARPGDLIYFPGHVSMIVAIKGDVVVYVSGEGGSAHTPARGVRYKTFNRKTTNYETFIYKSLIQMKGVFQD